eukprot:jgi/Chlat1/4974/Chrsp32S04956
MLLAAAAGLFLLFAATVWVLGSLPAWRRPRGVPGPKPLWLLGNALDLAKEENALNLWDRWFKQYGPIYCFMQGNKPAVVVTDPEMVRLINTKYARALRNRPDQAFMQAFGPSEKGMVFAKDKDWQQKRGAVTPLFHTSTLTTIYDKMTHEAESLIKLMKADIPNGAEVDVSTYMTKLTIEFGLLDASKASKETDELLRLCDRVIRLTSIGPDAPVSTVVGLLFPKWLAMCAHHIMRRFPSASDHELHNVKISLRQKLQALVDDRQKNLATHAETDALTLMLNARDRESGSPLPLSTVLGTAFELVLAGSDTTANTLSFTLFHLAANQSAQGKLIEEIDKYGPGTPSLEELHERFSYLDWVVQESMRISPTASALLREATSEPITLGGYTISEPQFLLINLYSIFRDPKLWGEDALEFRPERFDPASEEFKKRSPDAYVPFGMGARKCIGYRFAQQEAKLALVKLLQNFTFSTLHNELPVALSLVLKPKHGVPLRVHRRK